MKKIPVIFLSLVCLLNIAWVSKPSKDQELMRKGYQDWQSGDLTAAMHDYESVLALKPRNIDALNFLGVIYEELGLSQKAEEKYLTALKLNSNFLPVYLNLGLLYWNQGDIEKATYYLQKRIDKGNTKDPWTLKAKKALEAIQVKQKSDELKKSLDQTDPQRQVPNPARLNEVDQALDSIKLETNTIVAKPEEPAPNKEEELAQAAFTQGQQLAVQQKYQEAIRAYDRALKFTPGVPSILKARMDAFSLWKQQAINEQ